MSITCPKDATLPNLKKTFITHLKEGKLIQTHNFIQAICLCAHQKAELERSLHPVEYICCVVVSACSGEDVSDLYCK